MIELAELIRELRTELASAVDAAPADGLRFELGPVELEVSLAVERKANASGKVRFLVVDLGTDGTLGRSSTQRVQLTLHPRLAGSAGSPMVSGPEAAGER
ncbi:trypco2 family protein [Plantactinospora solaniradicis]|uniref:Trypco2 family protein n=1 Tax=Plantactinospora solaniradicis TaxID=1723736 RepID=A0ABW1KKI4_9ACTN